jgi:hypothetical protein
MTAKTNTTKTLIAASDTSVVPDYTSKAKALRELNKTKTTTKNTTKTTTVPAFVSGKPSRFPSEIVDSSPPCIPSEEAYKQHLPRGSVVGHFHTPSLIAAWKQLDEIF